ncbi:hypothetical protein CYY_006817 [Polysphondylium violaceum]|uniref:Uncharacterized protein n=1 Tax=Polysphondylium violaceum TaxID=133409 RepID=A0A8J4PQ07_9MYCE|nr:hypothetical protein CYY_006817 [Polysphondylium violaceum]
MLISDIPLICKCCSPPRYYQSPVLSVCDHIVCRDTVVQFGDTYVCSLCNSSSDQLDTESDRVRDIVNKIESKYLCKLHNKDIYQVCWTCNTAWCYLCENEDCKTYYSHDRNDILDSVNALNILDENIKEYMQDNSIKIQNNLDHLEQEIRNNDQIITRLRELNQYLKNRLDNHYLQSLETEFIVLENRLSSSINQLTETKQNINNYLNNFNTKKSTTQLYVQVLDWFKEKNSVFSYKIYSSTFQEYDIIDQLLNSYYQSQQHSLNPTTTPPTDQQQQFLITLNECIDIKESIDTRPLLCYPIINSYKFFNLPKHPIVDPINNSQLDLFLNSKTTPTKNNNNENDNNNDKNIDNVFHILNKDFLNNIDSYHVTRFFYYISESKFQFNYLFFVQTLDDYKNILIKLDKNFSHSPIVGDRELIDLFNRKTSNLTSVLIVYHRDFYDKYKDGLQYNNSNIKTIIISDSGFKANLPNVNIFGEHVLEPLSKEGLELLFNYLTDSIVSKDDIFYKPLMYTITKFNLKYIVENLTKEIRNKKKRQITSSIVNCKYNINTYRMLILINKLKLLLNIKSRSYRIMAPSEINPEKLIFKFPIGEMLMSLQVNFLESQTKQNNKWVPITITMMQSPKQCTDPYQLILTSEYAQIIVNNNTNGDVYNIKFDLRFKEICFNPLSKKGCINLIPLSGTFQSRSQGIQPLSLSNCFGTILHRPPPRPTQEFIHRKNYHRVVYRIEIDAIGYIFSTNNNNNQDSEKIIAIRLESGDEGINFINIEGMIHFIGNVKFIKDTDHLLIITSEYSRFANNNQLTFKSKDNQPIPDTDPSEYALIIVNKTSNSLIGAQVGFKKIIQLLFWSTIRLILGRSKRALSYVLLSHLSNILPLNLKIQYQFLHPLSLTEAMCLPPTLEILKLHCINGRICRNAIPSGEIETRNIGILPKLEDTLFGLIKLDSSLYTLKCHSTFFRSLKYYKVENVIPNSVCFLSLKWASASHQTIDLGIVPNSVETLVLKASGGMIDSLDALSDTVAYIDFGPTLTAYSFDSQRLTSLRHIKNLPWVQSTLSFPPYLESLHMTKNYYEKNFIQSFNNNSFPKNVPFINIVKK